MSTPDGSTFDVARCPAALTPLDDVDPRRRAQHGANVRTNADDQVALDD